MALRSASLAGLVGLSACVFACGGGGDDDGGPPATVNGPDGAAGEGEGGSGAQAGEGGSRSGGTGGSSGGSADAGNGSDAGGSGSSEDGGTPFEPVPIVELPGAFAGAICDALESCLGQAALLQLTHREDCARRVTGELAATEFAFMESAIASGAVLYDPAELPACLDGVRAMGCDVLADSFPQPCVDVLAGNVAIDGECTISAECEGTAFCAGGASATCPSTCTELLAQGDTCAADNECGDGLMCIGGTCEEPSVAGQPCGGDSGALCALGFNCMGSTDVDVGECVDNSSVQLGEEADPCEPGGTLCVEGLSCVFDGLAAFHCEPPVSAGAACHLGLPGQCPLDQYCDAASVSDQGTCRPLPVDGETCVLGDECAPAFACVLESDEPVCRPIRDNGGDCGGPQACRSGRCVDGKCEPPATCPGS